MGLPSVEGVAEIPVMAALESVFDVRGFEPEPGPGEPGDRTCSSLAYVRASRRRWRRGRVDRSRVQPYQAMTQKRGFFYTLSPGPNRYLPMAFGYRQGIPNPYSLRSHPTRLPVSARSPDLDLNISYEKRY